MLLRDGAVLLMWLILNLFLFGFVLIILSIALSLPCVVIILISTIYFFNKLNSISYFLLSFLLIKRIKEKKYSSSSFCGNCGKDIPPSILRKLGHPGKKDV